MNLPSITMSITLVPRARETALVASVTFTLIPTKNKKAEEVGQTFLTVIDREHYHSASMKSMHHVI